MELRLCQTFALQTIFQKDRLAISMKPLLQYPLAAEVSAGLPKAAAAVLLSSTNKFLKATFPGPLSQCLRWVSQLAGDLSQSLRCMSQTSGRASQCLRWVSHPLRWLSRELRWVSQGLRGLSQKLRLSSIPVPPVNPGTLPDVTEANAYGQMADLIADCKRSPNFTSNVASGLGVLAPGSDFDPAVNTPIVRLSLTVNGHPAFHLKNKMEYDGFEIWKLVQNAGPVPPPPPPNPNDGNFRKLERVFGVDFVDPGALPQFGQSQVWFYKYFYLLKNQQAGIGSAVFSINVSGVV
jgi:hypothetical protein